MIAINPLFEPTNRISFDEPMIDSIPKFGSILYTIWNRSDEFIYVGIGGIRGIKVEERNPRSRIMQHSQGIRSGDQFCIYVQDHFVLPQLLNKPYKAENGLLDRLVREYIRENLSYAYVIDQSQEGNNRVRDFERRIQQGAWHGLKPLLNPM